MKFVNHTHSHEWEMRKNNSFTKLAECMYARKFTNYSDYSEHPTPKGITSKQQKQLRMKIQEQIVWMPADMWSLSEHHLHCHHCAVQQPLAHAGRHNRLITGLFSSLLELDSTQQRTLGANFATYITTSHYTLAYNTSVASYCTQIKIQTLQSPKGSTCKRHPVVS